MPRDSRLWTSFFNHVKHFDLFLKHHDLLHTLWHYRSSRQRCRVFGRHCKCVEKKKREQFASTKLLGKTHGELGRCWALISLLRESSQSHHTLKLKWALIGCSRISSQSGCSMGTLRNKQLRAGIRVQIQYVLSYVLMKYLYFYLLTFSITIKLYF